MNDIAEIFEALRGKWDLRRYIPGHGSMTGTTQNILPLLIEYMAIEKTIVPIAIF